MLCPVCKGHSWVADSRYVKQGNSIRRRRRCYKCDHRFTTYELGVEDKKGEELRPILNALRLARPGDD